MRLASIPNISSIIYGRTPQRWLKDLHTAYPEWEFVIGKRHLGAKHFRSEHPDMEIISEYRPALLVRSDRVAVYCKKRQ